VKFQSACFEALGVEGVAALSHSIKAAKELGLGVILDAKRGDIAITATAYAKAYLTPLAHSDLEVDCLTVNPFLGPDSLAPFVACARDYGKGLLVLVKTSNPDSVWLQDDRCDGVGVSSRVAHLVAEYSAEMIGRSGLSSVGAVVGATFPAEARRLRAIMPDSILLMTGFGAQGAEAESVSAVRRTGSPGVLVPASRGVTYTTVENITLDAYAALIQQRISAFQAVLS
jgi:orotidine-5'-phosphate decarboxylase